MKKTCAVLLCLILFAGVLATIPVAAFSVVRTTQRVTVNGEAVVCDIYNIDGSNYFKVRDIAYLMNGTGSQFGISYNETTQAMIITTGAPYYPIGGEMEIGADLSGTAKSCEHTFIIDSLVAYFSAYDIGGDCYLKIRDIASAVGFDVAYDAETHSILITSRDTPALQGLVLSQTSLALYAGDTAYLSVSPSPSNAALPTLTWKSDKIGIATVNGNGCVTAVSAGTTTITVSGGGFSATCTVTVTARQAEEYRLGELIVRDANGAALTDIPHGKFLVTIPVTNLVSGGNAMVMLVSYSASGQFKGLLYVSVEDVPVGATIKVTLPVDNTKGDIALLKAFTIASFSNPVPIGAAVSFPAQ